MITTDFVKGKASLKLLHWTGPAQQVDCLIPPPKEGCIPLSALPNNTARKPAGFSPHCLFPELRADNLSIPFLKSLATQ